MSGFCWYCDTEILFHDYDARRVTVAAKAEAVCGPCWSKADVGPDVRLDYMEVRDDDNREGDPAFNGAFGG